MLSRLKIVACNRPCKNCMNFFKTSTNTKAKKNNDARYLYSLFFDQKVQSWLKLLTHIDESKVFQPRQIGNKISLPKYMLLSAEELKQKKKEIRRKLNRLMQIPPVLLPRPEKINVILDEDPGLDGHDLDHAKFIFTDISPKYKNERRVIVVREPNGTLRQAEWGERKRMNQIFFPIAGRKLYTPKMFEDENFKNVLERKEYKFILDVACVQFEPDDPEYIDVTRKTYDEINKNKDFKMLHSTRHFGSLTFYLALHKNIDNMIVDNIESEMIDDVFILLALYNKIHSFTFEEKGNEELLESYIASESNNKDLLELTWQNYKSKIKRMSEENNSEEEKVVI